LGGCSVLRAVDWAVVQCCVVAELKGVGDELSDRVNWLVLTTAGHTVAIELWQQVGPHADAVQKATASLLHQRHRSVFEKAFDPRCLYLFHCHL